MAGLCGCGGTTQSPMNEPTWDFPEEILPFPELRYKQPDFAGDLDRYLNIIHQRTAEISEALAELVRVICPENDDGPAETPPDTPSPTLCQICGESFRGWWITRVHMIRKHGKTHPDFEAVCVSKRGKTCGVMWGHTRRPCGERVALSDLSAHHAELHAPVFTKGGRKRKAQLAAQEVPNPKRDRVSST